ncbi:hypothetical protein RMCBS344292_07380 [Rhizopus microsporus]|nr:hypothetical protein RMCBS344292_07380 [Rhizopus microsporus]
MSMSVAILDPSTNKVHIFVKGAYEKIKDIADPHSIPSDYDLVTANQAREGCYVLALAHREVDYDKVDISNWTRDDMEKDIKFMGLIVFKNQLKEDTTKNIAELKRGDTRTIMITGDTALTGIYIARQCGMALHGSRFLLGDYDSQLKRVVWTDVDEPETFPDVNVDAPTERAVELAVTGKAFQWLVEHNLIRKHLLNIRVFARMTPSGKVQCVQLHMERGITAMTGDGGNDCGALRAAHVGIAMSDAEASIVSPFSTSNRSVASCVELLREGRAALATSLTGYKYLILYGQVMMMLKIFTFYFSVSMSANIWIAVDIFITVFLTWAVSQSKAADQLAPQRPTAQILGPQTLASGIGLVAINWIYLCCAYVLLFKQEFFRCNEFDSRAVDLSKWMLLSDNYEGEILALVCLFQFINNAAVFNFGYKFRQSFYKNYTLVALWLLYLIIASYWLLADPNPFGCLFRFNCGTPQVLQQIGYTPPSISITPYNTPLGHNVMPREFRWKLWGLIMGNLLTALAYEKFVVLGPIKDVANPHSIPSDYDLVTANQAREGCYVLALAHREVEYDKANISNWTRDDMEKDINFMGLIVFKNQLKEDTTKNIAELKRGDTRTIMITGDTALTGIYIARQCGMALHGSCFLLGDYDSQLKRVVWTDVDEPETFPDVNVDAPTERAVELAVTGKAFQWLVEHNLIRKHLLNIRVFARMTPSGKVQCVQLHMERGITAMTGDGGNDCGALRAAHVGIAMSDAEASIVSPFSTSNRSVASCVELLREGRAALATSLTGYKYLILYGQVMMMLKIFTFYFSVSMSANIWIAVDIFITVFLTWAVSQSKAADQLAPQRPTAQILGPQTLASGIGLVAINWIYLSCAYVLLFKQEFFRCNEFDSRAVDMSKWMLLSDNYEGEILALVCLFQFINNAAVFNFGYKFRQSFYKNYTLVALWLLYLIIASYWLLADPNPFGCLFRFNCGTPQVLQQIGYTPPSISITPYNTPLGHNVMPREFRWKLWGLIMGNLLTALVYEKFVVLGPVHDFLAKTFPIKRLKKTL